MNQYVMIGGTDSEEKSVNLIGGKIKNIPIIGLTDGQIVDLLDDLSCQYSKIYIGSLGHEIENFEELENFEIKGINEVGQMIDDYIRILRDFNIENTIVYSMTLYDLQKHLQNLPLESRQQVIFLLVMNSEERLKEVGCNLFLQLKDEKIVNLKICSNYLKEHIKISFHINDMVK